ncbi:MAG: hypothetical protein Q9162_002559 [Coniocarpon cinnabarinum]
MQIREESIAACELLRDTNGPDGTEDPQPQEMIQYARARTFGERGRQLLREPVEHPSSQESSSSWIVSQDVVTDIDTSITGSTRSASSVLVMVPPPVWESMNTSPDEVIEADRQQDFQDLFCTLMVALPLGTHRHRLTRYPQTFTTSEALNHLGNLRFTQSNRRPSPNDPNVMVTTKIATTFSMVAPMARSLCNKFLAARLVESIEGKVEFSTADSIWQLTSKGIKLLENFAHRNGVSERHVFDVLDSPRNKMNLLVLEREPETDQLNRDTQTINVIFRRFTGPHPNVPSKDYSSDSENSFDSDGNIGVRMHRDRKIANKYHQYTFSQRAAIDWLMNCCTMVDVREAYEIINLLCDHDFIRVIQEDKTSPSGRANGRPNNSRGSIYKMTERGQTVAGWIPDRKPSPTDARDRSPAGNFRDSNTNRMLFIVQTPSLRLLFREYLKETHCEENLIFYLEVKDFLGRWTGTLRRQKASMDSPPLDTVRETLAAAYDLYNAFLAPGSPCELNIDHTLRNALVSRMTRFELPDIELLQTVKEVIQLYDQAQTSVFKLMASDSVPKFLRDPNYAKQINKFNAEHGGGLNAESVATTGRLAGVSS